MNKIKLKDLVLIALLTVIYLLLYVMIMMGVTMLGPVGHAMSPGGAALLGGAVIIFMNRKVGKMWEYTIFTLLIMGAFALMGGGYIPWLISSVSMALIADLLASRSNNAPIWKIALASGLMHVGHAWGAVIPSVFFLESYRSHWIDRGMKPDEMDAMIKATSGLMGLIATVVVFAMGVAGVYLGYLILKKYLEKMK